MVVKGAPRQAVLKGSGETEGSRERRNRTELMFIDESKPIVRPKQKKEGPHGSDEQEFTGATQELKANTVHS